MSSAAPPEETPLGSAGTPPAVPVRSGFFGLLTWLGLAVAVGIGLLAAFLSLRQETAARERLQARAEAAGVLVSFSGHSDCPAWLRPRGPDAMKRWLTKHWLPFWDRADTVRVQQHRSRRTLADDVLGDDLKSFRTLSRVEFVAVQVTTKELVALVPRVPQVAVLASDVLAGRASVPNETPVLRSLSLESSRVEPHALDPLMEASSLRELDFMLDRASTQHVLESAAASKSLTTLRIQSSDLRKSTALKFAEPFPALEKLRIEAATLDASSLSPFSGAPALHTIELARMYGRDRGPKLVVARMPVLRTLSAHRTTVSGFELVDTPQLAFVELNHIQLAEGAFQNCATWSSVETLKLPHSGVSKTMLAQIAQMPRLQHLDIRHFRDELYRRRRNFTASDLEPLAELKTLATVEIERTMTRSERNTVQKSLPRVSLLGDTIN